MKLFFYDFQCVHMLEEYEEDITEWYFKYREHDLLDWLCKLRVLKKEDQGNILSKPIL
jgi:hypothetical protein